MATAFNIYSETFEGQRPSFFLAVLLLSMIDRFAKKKHFANLFLFFAQTLGEMFLQ